MDDQDNNLDEEINRATKVGANILKNTGSRAIKFILKTIGIKILLIILIVVIIIVFFAGAVYILDLDNAKLPSSTSDKDYTENSPLAYNNKIYISENGALVPEISAQDVWDNDKRYSQYLTDVDSLSYLLNAQFVSQYPYIDSLSDDELNGTIKFYRNNNIDSETYMQYIAADEMDNYLNMYNSGQISDEYVNKALNSFSINEDGTIKILYIESKVNKVATSDIEAANEAANIMHSNIDQKANEYVVVSNTSTMNSINLNYKSLIQKYILPFELLWEIVVIGDNGGSAKGNSEDFAKMMASMAYDGTIDLIIDDQFVVNETEDIYDYYTSIRSDYSSIRMYKDSNPYMSFSSFENYTYRNNKVTHTQIETTRTPVLRIKQIVSWCAILNNDAKYEEIETEETEINNGRAEAENWKERNSLNSDHSVFPLRYEDLGDSVLLNKEYETEDGSKTTINKLVRDAYKEYDENKTITKNEESLIKPEFDVYFKVEKFTRKNGAESSEDVPITVTTYKTKTCSKYGEGTVTTPVLNEDIVKLFNVNSFRTVRSYFTGSYHSWLVEAMEENARTANMVDLINYILNKATETEKFGKFEDFESVWNKIGSSMTNVESSDIINLSREFINVWEGSTELSSDGTKYKIENDGYDNLAVGHGIDIYNGGFESDFKERGYEIKEGTWVDKDFVDELENKAIEKWYEQVIEEVDGLNLTNYQIAALVSRCYNCGFGGGLLNSYGNGIFINLYNNYWSNEKSNKYYGKNDNLAALFNEELYTGYMKDTVYASGSYSPGLENRRKSEWILFSTGYNNKTNQLMSK